MVNYCVVFDCRSSYKTKKCSMFSCTDPKLLEKWNEVVPRFKEKLSKHDRVCEKHFKASDIIREWTALDGITKVPLKQVRLKPNAIPSIFRNCYPNVKKKLKIKEKFVLDERPASTGSIPTTPYNVIQKMEPLNSSSKNNFASELIIKDDASVFPSLTKCIVIKEEPALVEHIESIDDTSATSDEVKQKMETSQNNFEYKFIPNSNPNVFANCLNTCVTLKEEPLADEHLASTDDMSTTSSHVEEKMETVELAYKNNFALKLIPVSDPSTITNCLNTSVILKEDPLLVEPVASTPTTAKQKIETMDMVSKTNFELKLIEISNPSILFPNSLKTCIIMKEKPKSSNENISMIIDQVSREEKTVESPSTKNKFMGLWTTLHEIELPSSMWSFTKIENCMSKKMIIFQEMDYSTILKNPYIRSYISVSEDLLLKVCIKDNELRQKDFKKMGLENLTSDPNIGECIKTLMSKLTSLRICCGGPDIKTFPNQLSSNSKLHAGTGFWHHIKCLRFGNFQSACGLCLRLRRYYKRKSNLKKKTLRDKIKSMQSANRIMKFRTKKKLEYLQNKLINVQEKYEQLSESSCTEQINELKIPDAQKMLMLECVRSAKFSSKTKKRYSSEWLEFCINLYNSNKSVYHFLRKNEIIPLPSLYLP